MMYLLIKLTHVACTLERKYMFCLTENLALVPKNNNIYTFVYAVYIFKPHKKIIQWIITLWLLFAVHPGDLYEAAAPILLIWSHQQPRSVNSLSTTIQIQQVNTKTTVSLPYTTAELMNISHSNTFAPHTVYWI
jgi:hypothetical protein